MNRSSSSGVGSNATGGGMTSEVRCFCGLISEVKQAWTDDNLLLCISKVEVLQFLQVV